MDSNSRAATLDPPVVGELTASEVPAAYVPADQLNGMEEFGTLRNWVSFDQTRGRFVCQSLGLDTDEFIGSIIASRVVRVMKDPDGNVLCSSSDRLVADNGRPGRVCATCPDREVHCFPRWWIAWQELESGLIFAHTLSQTGSFNFNKYANLLLSVHALPSQALTRIFVEEAQRKKAKTTYRRIQFERMDAPG